MFKSKNKKVMYMPALYASVVKLVYTNMLECCCTEMFPLCKSRYVQRNLRQRLCLFNLLLNVHRN